MHIHVERNLVSYGGFSNEFNVDVVKVDLRLVEFGMNLIEVELYRNKQA